jgi:hypothetical protein
LTSAKATFTRFGALSLGLATLLVLLGYLPTLRIGGADAVPAMFAGVAIAVFASLAGAVPVFRSRNTPTVDAWGPAMGSMGVRLAVAVGLGVALSLSGLWPAKALLLWVVIGHGAMLIPDTQLSISVLAHNAPVEDR